MKLILRLLIFVTISANAFAQISINPMILYLDKDTRTGTFDVTNPSKELREFKLDFQFGFPKYDSIGRQEMEYKDSVMAKEYSLLPYLKFFPKRLVIPPGESQTVRFIVSGLPENIDGTYWTRVIGESDPVVKQIDTSSRNAEPGKIRPVIVLRSVVNGIIIYQKGNVTASVDFEFKRKFKDSVNTHFLFDFAKSGNSPFLGIAEYKISDANNNVVAEKSDNIAIYQTAVIDFAIKSTELAAGKLKFELTVNNERKNVPEEFYIPFKPVTKTFFIDN